MTKLRGRKPGRVKVAFAEFLSLAEPHSALVQALQGDWALTQHSALFRRKDGTFTLRLVWHGSNGTTLTKVIRNLRLATT